MGQVVVDHQHVPPGESLLLAGTEGDLPALKLQSREAGADKILAGVVSAVVDEAIDGVLLRLPQAFRLVHLYGGVRQLHGGHGL